MISIKLFSRMSLLSLMASLSFSTETLAMGSAPLPGGQTAPTTGSRYDEGYGLGERNGTLISQRLYDRTVGIEGCSQLEAYQNALLRVNRTIKAPSLNADSDQDLVRGFFRGYLDTVRKAIQDSRKGCKKVAFDSGVFPGQFYGSLICQAVQVNIDLVQTLDAEPLYDGWSGGIAERSIECESSASIEVKSCLEASTILPSIVVSSVQSACKI